MHRLIDRKRIERTWTRENLESNARITAKCYLKLGEWHSQMQLNTVGTTTSTMGARRGSIAIPIGANFSMVPAFHMGNSLPQDNVPVNINQQYYRQLNYQR